MPLPVILKTYRCALKWVNSAGGTATTVTHWRLVGAETNPSDHAEDLVVQWHANDAAAMYQHTVTTVTGTEFEVTPLDGETATYQTGAVGIGGNAAGHAIPEGCVLLRFGTGFRGPRNNGRAYLPFVAEALVDTGLLSGNAAPANFNTGWSSFVAAMLVDGWELVVASYVASLARPVTSVGVAPYMALQTRRLERIRT